MVIVSSSELENWLTQRVATLANVDGSAVDRHEFFSVFGLDSVDAVSLSGELGEWLGLDLSPNVAWEYPTIAQLALHLAQQLSGTPGAVPSRLA